MPTASRSRLLSTLTLLGTAYCLLATGCLNRADSRPGIVVDTDGNMLATTSENMALVDANRIARDATNLAREQAPQIPNGSIRAVLSSMPTASYDADGMTDWHYQTLQVTIYTSTTTQLTADMIQQLVSKRFGQRMDGPASTRSQRLSSQLISGSVPTTLSHAAVASTHGLETVTVAPPEHATASSPQTAPNQAENSVAKPVIQRYRIQAGDSLAAISSVFYGSPQHWRPIVEANPGLDPAALAVGTEIVIPVLTSH